MSRGLEIRDEEVRGRRGEPFMEGKVIQFTKLSDEEMLSGPKASRSILEGGGNDQSWQGETN